MAQPFSIYVVDLDSGQLQQISQSPDGDEYNPTWSNDGKHLVHDVVFYSDGSQSLLITDVRTGVDTSLLGSDNGNNGTWSPDGQLIAFDRSPWPAYDSTIYVVPPTGGIPPPVKHGAITVKWSPDSQFPVFQQPSDGSIRTASLSGGPGQTAQFLDFGLICELQWPP